MAEWKKVVVSGSAAQLASLTLDSALGVQYGGTGNSSIGTGNMFIGSGTTSMTAVGTNGSGSVVRSTGAQGIIMSGSFSGSFIGSGTGLTGILADSTFAIHGSDGTSGSFATATDTIKFSTGSAHGFSFSITDATQLLVLLNTPQDLRTTANVLFGTVTGSSFKATAMPTGVDNTVVVLDANGNFVTDEIDSRVWGTTLIDGAGSNTRVAYFSDADTLTSNAGFTFDGTLLTVGSSTFGSDTVIAGNLTVLGTTTNINITNLNVEDRFILLNSGSSTGDGGFIVQTETGMSGSMFGWDDSATRFGMQINTKVGADESVITPDAYIVSVVDIDGGMSDVAIHQKNGNIKTNAGEIYIYS
jgi:hypothetical protein